MLFFIDYKANSQMNGLGVKNLAVAWEIDKFEVYQIGRRI